MIRVFDMSTGEREEGFGDYEDEVLSANWTPAPELGLRLEVVSSGSSSRQMPVRDPDAFLRSVYLSQE